MTQYQGKTVESIFECSEIRYVEHEDGLYTPFNVGGIDIIDDEGRIHEVQSSLLPAMGDNPFYIIDFVGNPRDLVTVTDFAAGVS